MSRRMPLYFKRGYPGHGPGPYRRLLRSRHAAWRVANKHGDTIQRVQDVCDRELVDAPLKMMSPGRLGYRNALRDVLDALDGM